ncbi:MAG TPA: hypothetical protein VFB33_00880, partial [Candidatus Binataceae bacterium]|nr:hypothetical protein [Candidatus Binataceae bacterium]
AALGAQDLWEGGGPGRALRLGALATCAALVTLLNPYGLNLWRIVAHTLRNPYTMGVGAEFQTFLSVLRGLYRAGAPTLPLLFALALMGALPVSFALAPSADDLPELTVAAMMVALALYSARNSAFAMIACASPVAFHCDLALARLRRSSRLAAARQMKLTGETAQAKAVSAADPGAPGAIRAVPGVQIAALAAAAALALNAGIFSSRLPAYTGYPAGAVAFMERHALSGRILNRFIWGSYIFWHLGLRSRVFIDGRFEMVYPLKVQADYLDFLRGGARAARVLGGYPHDFVLFQTDTPPYRFMMKQEGWRLIYRDPVAAFFTRADSPAARIAGIPEVHATAPPSMFP